MIGGKNNYWILALIIVIAGVVRLYGLNLGQELSPEQKASVILSVSASILSVFGLYFLVKELFDEKLAATASFLLAVSSWHVFISKLGTKDIFISFVLIFALYFLWHGLKYGHIFDFFLAGIFGGSGFYASKSYFFAPFIVFLVFLNYWDYIKKDFSLSKYSQAKAQVLSGFSLLVLTIIAVTLPIVLYLWQNPGFILSADNSIFSNSLTTLTTGTEPLAQLYRNFVWVADKIILIEFDGSNLVSWLISIFFVVGFIKEFVHWAKRKHGHFSVVHTFIFSWLFVMLVPVLLSADEPSASSLSVILPVVIIIAARGLWWVIEKLNRWDHLVYPHPHKHWNDLNASPFLAMLALLLSIAILEISKLS